MIVVTTPTGHIGSGVTQRLLSAGEPVRVIARDPSKLPTEVRTQVEVVPGSHGDPEVLARALAGAEALFWVVPPNPAAPDVLAYYLGFARAACAAIAETGVSRVVAVSATGRGSRRAAGPVSAAFASDAEFERCGVGYRALWCPSFMDNMLMQLASIRSRGVFSLPEPPDVKSPHVATRDIASSGARLLMDRTWTGQGGLAVLGPKDLSNDDMAAILSEVLERPIRYQQVSGHEYKALLMQHGSSESFAEGLVAMHEAKGHGLDTSVSRTPENTTPTSFRQWCEEVLKPAFLAA